MVLFKMLGATSPILYLTSGFFFSKGRDLLSFWLECACNCTIFSCRIWIFPLLSALLTRDRWTFTSLVNVRRIIWLFQINSTEVLNLHSLPRKQGRHYSHTELILDQGRDLIWRMRLQVELEQGSPTSATWEFVELKSTFLQVAEVESQS